MALLGSGIGAALSILIKLPTAETRIGLHGFNQVLVMIALTSFCSTYLADISYGNTGYCRMLRSGYACTPKIFWTMGASRTHGTICIHSVGLAYSHLRILSHSGWNRLVKTRGLIGNLRGNAWYWNIAFHFIYIGIKVYV